MKLGHIVHDIRHPHRCGVLVSLTRYRVAVVLADGTRCVFDNRFARRRRGKPFVKKECAK